MARDKILCLLIMAGLFSLSFAGLGSAQTNQRGNLAEVRSDGPWCTVVIQNDPFVLSLSRTPAARGSDSILNLLLTSPRLSTPETSGAASWRTFAPMRRVAPHHTVTRVESAVAASRNEILVGINFLENDNHITLARFPLAPFLDGKTAGASPSEGTSETLAGQMNLSLPTISLNFTNVKPLNKAPLPPNTYSEYVLGSLAFFRERYCIAGLNRVSRSDVDIWVGSLHWEANRETPTGDHQLVSVLATGDGRLPHLEVFQSELLCFFLFFDRMPSALAYPQPRLRAWRSGDALEWVEWSPGVALADIQNVAAMVDGDALYLACFTKAPSPAVHVFRMAANEKTFTPYETPVPVAAADVASVQQQFALAMVDGELQLLTKHRDKDTNRDAIRVERVKKEEDKERPVRTIAFPFPARQGSN